MLARFLLPLALLLAGVVHAEAVAWQRGWWYDGERFSRGTRYTVDGVFSARRPESIDRVVDLNGGWVVPAFGDAA